MPHTACALTGPSPSASAKASAALSPCRATMLPTSRRPGRGGGTVWTGRVLLRGPGRAQSYERAAELWQQAAAKGYAEAQFLLGTLYYEGKGVPKDVARGVALLKQAAAGASKKAADNLRAMGEAVPPGAPA